MSDIEGGGRSRPRTRSQATSRESSRASSVSKPEAKEKSKIKSILRRSSGSKDKSSKAKSKSRSRSRSPATSLSSVASSGKEKERDSAAEDESEAEGLIPILKNLHHGTHVALSDKDSEAKGKADKLIKRDAGKNLAEAVKKERLKGAQMFAALLGRGLPEEQEVPQFKAFNKKKPPCSLEAFEKHLKSFIHQFPRFSGKSSEFLYFLVELDAVRRSANLSDEQTQRILQNRLSGRFQSYFMTELRREKDIVKVLNRLGRDYVDAIDPAAEIEKCVNYRLKFQDTAEELVRLKEIMSFAYPHMTRDILRQHYIQKVVELVPKEARHALIDDFEQQRALEKQGFAPLTDYEVDAKILKHCRAFERRQQSSKQIFKVSAKNDERPNGESRPVKYAASEASESGASVGQPKKGKQKNQLEEIVKSVKQLGKKVDRKIVSDEWHVIGQVSGQPEGVPNEAVSGAREGPSKGYQQGPPRQYYGNRAPQNGAPYLSSQPRGPRPPFQPQRPPRAPFYPPRQPFPPQRPRSMNPVQPYQQNSYYQRQGNPNQRPQNNYQRGNQQNYPPKMAPPQQVNPGGNPQGQRQGIILASPGDPRYSELVKEVKETSQLKYLGEKIRNDVRNATENFRQVLSQARADRPKGQEIYVWNDQGKYKVDGCPKIEGPVFRKIGNRTPDLTAEVLKRFANCCHACGFKECPGKGRKSAGLHKCAYNDKPDSWYPCQNCMRGFHLTKDCLADIKN